MIAVLASHFDRPARELVTRWGAHRASLLTSDDLSTIGWRHYIGFDERPAAVIGGRIVLPGDIKGVLVRLPVVTEHELHLIRPADRTYVAAEMTAFLLAWLSSLSCPVVNRPTPGCLSGPAWRPEQWTWAAARAGLRVQPRRRSVALGVAPLGPLLPAGVTEITLVGDRAIGPVEPQLVDMARRLARSAGVELLVTRFDGDGHQARLVEAVPWVDISSPEVADALLSRFEEARVR